MPEKKKKRTVEEALALLELEEKNPDRIGPGKSTILSKVQKNKQTKVDEAVLWVCQSLHFVDNNNTTYVNVC